MGIFERRPSGSTTRRDLLRRAGAIGLGAGLAVVGAQVVTAEPAAAGVQSDWRYCAYCKSMVWGVLTRYCRASGNFHRGAGSFNYYMNYAPQSVPSPNQSQWGHCYQCNSMFYYGFNGSNGGGQCPSGGAHWAYPSNYILTTSTTSGGQSGWRFCNRCYTLFYGPYQSTSVCAFDGNHDGQYSFDYRISYSPT